MIRILVYIASIIGAVWLISILAELSGVAVIELEGQRFDITTSGLIGLIIIGALIFLFGGALLNWLGGLPRRLRRGRADAKRQRGMTALTRGLEAVAAGDAEDAQRLARQASRNLEEPALTRLLTAQAAHIAGDRAIAESAYAAMLDAPETEFLGLRGLYMQALERGDREEARNYAERAFHLRPGASWAFESVLALSVERGAWSDALDAIALAKGHETAKGPTYRRMEAALLAARASTTSDETDSAAQAKEAEAAFRKAPTLTPAAAIAAEAEMRAGRRAKAAKILGDAWEAEPHPGLAVVMERIFAHERDERRRDRLIKLTERRPDHPESRLLLAQTQLEAGDAQAAQDTLEPLLSGRPRRRALSLMADIAEARFGSEASAVWSAKAEAAPPEFIPGADGVFHYTTEGWRRLIREYSAHERLAPPPLEVETPEIALEEVQLLLAPPPAVVISDSEAENTEADETLTAEVVPIEPAPSPDEDDDGQVTTDIAETEENSDPDADNEKAASRAAS
ncbi:MAG: heme biosynthesis HemY N-terminal domain-containing protein [Parvularcula sp.]|jgi:HemY protein|nr:heme biosynthesis HemY N-terminal domain-containing protein [Parvularcula sp.]